jgi:6-phosphogluconolactonase
MTPTISKFKDEKAYVKAAVQAIETALTKSLEERTLVRVALSGGQSPLPVYDALAKSKNIPWSRVRLFLVDERYVPANSNDSNQKAIRLHLTDHLKSLRDFYVYNTREPKEKLVHQYEEVLKLQDSPLFDLVILGMGEDGHTASLFPSSPALLEEKRLITTAFAPVEPHERITLTFPAILDSRKIIVLVKGAKKERILDRALSGRASEEELPLAKILDHSDIEVYFNAV